MVLWYIILVYHNKGTDIKMTLLHIHNKQAQSVHSELIRALGTENKPAQWLIFMEAAKKHLPFLFEAGRPTMDQIEHSVIGQLGFKSWGEMVEASEESNGLGWSINSWKMWSKAYKVVVANPFLSEKNITASAVMKLKSTFKDSFPQNADELERLQVEKLEQKKLDESQKVEKLQAKIAALELDLSAYQGKNEVLVQQVDKLQNLLREQKAEKTLGLWTRVKNIFSK